jgi:hypothetical protein
VSAGTYTVQPIASTHAPVERATHTPRMRSRNESTSASECAPNVAVAPVRRDPSVDHAQRVRDDRE